ISCAFEVFRNWIASEIDVAPIVTDATGDSELDFPVQITQVSGSAAIGGALRPLSKGVVDIGDSTSSIYLGEAILGIVGVAVIAVVQQIAGSIITEPYKPVLRVCALVEIEAGASRTGLVRAVAPSISAPGQPRTGASWRGVAVQAIEPVVAVCACKRLCPIGV